MLEAPSKVCQPSPNGEKAVTEKAERQSCVTLSELCGQGEGLCPKNIELQRPGVKGTSLWMDFVFCLCLWSRSICLVFTCTHLLGAAPPHFFPLSFHGLQDLFLADIIIPRNHRHETRPYSSLKARGFPQVRPLQAGPCGKAAGIDGEEAQRVKRGVGRKLWLLQARMKHAGLG